jgi:PIN domain nuclease of toxin-antitoxin system
VLLLDTCALIWLADGTIDTSPARPEIEAAAETRLLSVSVTSAWELGLLSRAKRLEFSPDAKAWFATIVGRAGLRLTPITPAIAIDASHLPGPLHNDPADRLIIATARHLEARIVTRDHRIIDYAAAGHVGILAC